MLARALAKRAANRASGNPAMAWVFRWLCGGIRRVAPREAELPARN